MCSSPLQSEIPVNLRHGVYDVCIVSAPEDAEERDKFSKILKKFVRLKDGYEPEIVLVDETSSDDTFIDRVMKIAELAFENSSFVWYFLTENFLQWTKGDLLKDVSLLQALEERKHHVIPVYAEAKHKEIEHPFGLRVFKGIDLFALLKRRSLQEVDVNSLGKNDIDSISLNMITKMLNDRLDQKYAKKREKAKLKQDWIEFHQRKQLLKQQCQQQQQQKQQQLQQLQQQPQQQQQQLLLPQQQLQQQRLQQFLSNNLGQHSINSNISMPMHTGDSLSAYASNQVPMSNLQLLPFNYGMFTSSSSVCPPNMPVFVQTPNGFQPLLNGQMPPPNVPLFILSPVGFQPLNSHITANSGMHCYGNTNSNAKTKVVYEVESISDNVNTNLSTVGASNFDNNTQLKTKEPQVTFLNVSNTQVPQARSITRQTAKIEPLQKTRHNSSNSNSDETETAFKRPVNVGDETPIKQPFNQNNIAPIKFSEIKGHIVNEFQNLDEDETNMKQINTSSKNYDDDDTDIKKPISELKEIVESNNKKPQAEKQNEENFEDLINDELFNSKNECSDKSDNVVSCPNDNVGIAISNTNHPNLSLIFQRSNATVKLNCANTNVSKNVTSLPLESAASSEDPSERNHMSCPTIINMQDQESSTNNKNNDSGLGKSVASGNLPSSTLSKSSLCYDSSSTSMSQVSYNNNKGDGEQDEKQIAKKQLLSNADATRLPADFLKATPQTHCKITNNVNATCVQLQEMSLSNLVSAPQSLFINNLASLEPSNSAPETERLVNNSISSIPVTTQSNPSSANARQNDKTVKKSLWSQFKDKFT